MRIPGLGRRLRCKVAKPYTGWTTDWDEHAAIDATEYTQLPGTARSALKIMRDMADANSADTALIAAPTLVISGSADTRMPPSVGEAIAGNIPGARHVVLTDCPHGLANHQPQNVADFIVDR